MRADQIDLSTMSPTQKVALMERLWVSLTQEGQQMMPPGWHQKELEKRDPEWLNREEVAEDWSAVREELRGNLP